MESSAQFELGKTVSLLLCLIGALLFKPTWLKLFYTDMITVQPYINSFFAIRRGLSFCILPRLFYKERNSDLFSLPRNDSELNSENLRLFLFHETEFRAVFSSAEEFGTKFREVSVPWNSRNSVGNNHLFRLFRLPWNYFFVGNSQP